MNNVQKAILPGLIGGILAVVGISGLIYSPQIVLASTAELAPQPEVILDLDEGAVESVTHSVAHSAGSCSLSEAYPETVRQWCDWIEQYAGQYQVDAQLLAAVMLQESGGDPNALSRSGAVGLMQVMPRDGTASNFMCKNGPCFADRPSAQELYDPEFNIAYGASLLSELIGKLGSAREALRAYGPMDMGYYYADLVLTIYEQRLSD